MSSSSALSAPPAAGESRLPRPGAERRWLALCVGLGAAPALLLVAAGRFLLGEWVFPLDDSYIHLVFARSLAAGEGLAFNPGELVAGSTAPLWTALVALLAILPGPVALWTQLAGVAFHGATVAATFGLARRLELAPRRAALAAVLVAIADWLLFSAPSGMEVPLFTFLSLAALARHLDERRDPELAPLSFVLFAAAALARPEGLMLLPLAALDRLLPRARIGGRELRAIAAGAAAAALVLVPVALVFAQISGSIFPTTLVAKSSGPPVWVPQLQFLRGVFGLLFASQPWMSLLALGGAVEIARRLGGERDRGLILPLWLLALPVGSAMLSSGHEIAVGNFGRYFFPLLPPIVVLGVVALDRLSWSRLREALGPAVAGLAAALCLAPATLLPLRAAGVYLTACANVRDSDLAAARWLAPRLDPRALVAVNDIGAFRWVLPNRIVDLVGIVDPPIAARRRAGVLARENHEAVLVEVVAARRPDYVAVFPSWFPAPERDPASFPVAQRFAIRDNIAMAGDMIAIYATPWNRYPLAESAGGANLPESP